MNKINTFMMYIRNRSKKFTALRSMILQLYSEQERVEQHRLNNITSNYFKKKFPKCKINVKIKYDGLQLGNIVKINPYNKLSLFR